MKNAILSAVASYRAEMTRFTRELVSIPTENPPGRFYRECVDALGGEIRSLGLDCRIREVEEREEGAANRTPRFWLESFFGKEGRVLYFHGHYDVVPAADEEQFQPQIEGDILYGRGTSDMKGGIAAMVYALRALKDCDVPLNGRVGLTIVPDEETGGRLGTRHLAENGLLAKDGIGMLTAEPTSGVVWNASRGAVTLRVIVKGLASHVGLQCRGINAFERMLRVGQTLLELKNEVEKRKTAFRIEPEEARNSILMMGGVVEGGNGFNLVPDRCSFTLDRRINPEENLAVEKKRILDVLDRLNIDMEVETIQEGASAGVSEDIPLGRALAESIEDVTEQPARFEMCPGLLEIRFYAERDVPAFAYGPGLLAASHGPGEYVQVSDIEKAAAVYALTAARVLSSNI
jgi:acetylornithine deacetylase/succinyl-diaminopimelate desuccinylase family protein